jgi:hypothetical protein
MNLGEEDIFIPDTATRCLYGTANNLILNPMKKYLLLVILLFYCFSCASQKREIIAKSTIKLEGRNTNIRDLIEIDGYYYMKEYPDSNCRVFFEDGTWVDFYFKRDVSNDDKADMSKSIHSRIEKKQVRWGSFWGVYRTQNDTIIVYRYMKGSFWEVWSLSEERYKVVDRETVQRISCRGLLKADESSNDIYGTKVNDTFHFTPADSLPSSDCWLKEEKWIWRNESDWKEYMERIKQIKKQYKKK